MLSAIPLFAKGMTTGYEPFEREGEREIGILLAHQVTHWTVGEHGQDSHAYKQVVNTAKVPIFASAQSRLSHQHPEEVYRSCALLRCAPWGTFCFFVMTLKPRVE